MDSKARLPFRLTAWNFESYTAPAAATAGGRCAEALHVRDQQAPVHQKSASPERPARFLGLDAYGGVSGYRDKPKTTRADEGGTART
jgi:hypothetical protein